MATETPQESAPSSFRFERRRHDRWPTSGVAVACRLAGERFGEMTIIRLVDYSDAGLGATCGKPLEPGTLVTVGFRSPGYPMQRGVVSRCLPCGDGYRLAIQFELRMAA